MKDVLVQVSLVVLLRTDEGRRPNKGQDRLQASFIGCQVSSRSQNRRTFTPDLQPESLSYCEELQDNYILVLRRVNMSGDSLRMVKEMIQVV